MYGKAGSSMKRRSLSAFCFCLVICFPFGNAWGVRAQNPPASAVATAHPLATEAGLEILAAGGNAFDAAVAVTALLAVVEPFGSGLGGGGFWLLHRAADGYQTMVDGREKAPAAAHRDMYLDERGRVVPRRSVDGPLAAGIPGTPAALVHLARRYGRLPLSVSLAPAIRLARKGFPVGPIYRRMAGFRLSALRASPAAAAIFLKDGEVPEKGYLIRQPQLAEVLQAMAEKGAPGFYEGEVARKLVEGVRRAGGIWTLADLRNYRVVERVPIRGRLGGVTVVSAAPPSSGGIVLLTMLNILQCFEWENMPPVTQVHLMTEAMRRAYRDRAQYLGDPDFVSIPVRRLISPDYAAGLAAGIRLDRATPSISLPILGGERAQGEHTTHFSILDQEGNRVAATMSINYPFGSGFVPPGTGVVLNDEMDDFSVKPGAPNLYGLIGAEANAIAPGKRPLSSMTPTFLESDEGVAILGTPGGSRIITMVLLATLEYMAGKPPQDWVSRPRFHHQFLPDRIEFEPGALSEKEQSLLREMGHLLEPLEDTYGNMQAVLWDISRQRVLAASDPRGEGHAEVRRFPLGRKGTERDGIH